MTARAAPNFFLLATATRKQYLGTQGAEYDRKSDQTFHPNFRSKLAADQELTSYFAVILRILRSKRVGVPGFRGRNRSGDDERRNLFHRRRSLSWWCYANSK
jgi:hypothetical protein